MKPRAMLIVLCLLLLCISCNLSGGSGGGESSGANSLAGHWTGRWTDSDGESGDAKADLNQEGRHLWGTFEATNSILEGPQPIDVTLPSDSSSGEFDQNYTIEGVTVHIHAKYDPSSIIITATTTGYTVNVSLHR